MSDTSQQFVADAHGAILNNDEKAWEAYVAHRAQVMALTKLQRQVTALAARVVELEKRLDEATTSS